LAKQLLVAALWQHASRLSSAVLEQPFVDPRQETIRRMAMRDLAKLVQNDDKFADAHLLQAKLQALQGGDRAAAMKSIERAIELFKDNAKQRSSALIVRAQLQQDATKRDADFDAAVEADPTNVEAWKARAAYHLVRGEREKAVKDFDELLKRDPTNVAVRQALAEALLALDKYDLALEHANKAIDMAQDPADQSVGYILRAQIYEAQNKIKEALADTEQALKKDPTNVVALLTQARLHLGKDDLAAAREAVDRVLRVDPNRPNAILLRSLILARQGRYQDAIADIRLLLLSNPKNVELRLQLASLLVADHRPRKAIELLTELLNEDKNNVSALRARGDAFLGVGKHAEAIQDYNVAVRLDPDDDGILNNLAWVLATSPVDTLRDGKRSIHLATKACEVTKYEKSHILSTLAAGYAETGDFETAIKWSTKAIELGEKELHEQLDQLKQELESYKQKKPFRELQNVEEKPDPPRNVIDT
jgi:tetratricopeptide (TPR) repeat protein